jgi:hypothetical protein
MRSIIYVAWLAILFCVVTGQSSQDQSPTHTIEKWKIKVNSEIDPSKRGRYVQRLVKMAQHFISKNKQTIQSRNLLIHKDAQKLARNSAKINDLNGDIDDIKKQIDILE